MFHPSYRPPSRKQQPGFASEQDRRDFAGAFSTGADKYDAVRPGYPAQIHDLLAGYGRVVDIGAGTGKFIAKCQAPERFACDPSAQMVAALRSRLSIPVWRATAEHTALCDAAVDAAVCAQAWHWVDVPAACTELGRVIKEDGVVLLVWNTIDVEADPWVLRLTRIMHSGDVLRSGFLPQVAPPWEISTTTRCRWHHQLTPDQLHLLMHTRSYWLRANPATRQRMTDNLNWYLFEHLGFSAQQPVELPYRTDAFVLRRGASH